MDPTRPAISFRVPNCAPAEDLFLLGALPLKTTTPLTTSSVCASEKTEGRERTGILNFPFFSTPEQEG